jgi:hypothetical protein
MVRCACHPQMQSRDASIKLSAVQGAPPSPCMMCMMAMAWQACESRAVFGSAGTVLDWSHIAVPADHGPVLHEFMLALGRNNDSTPRTMRDNWLYRVQLVATDVAGTSTTSFTK